MSASSISSRTRIQSQHTSMEDDESRKKSQNTFPHESRLEVWKTDLSKRGRTVNAQLLLKTGSKISCSDVEATTCFELMKKVANFFETVIGVCPVNNSKKLMRCYIQIPETSGHWSKRRDGVVFGVNDERYFNGSEATNLDCLTHEFSHAVIQYYGNLGHKKIGGALSEGIADIFAIAHKHFRNWEADHTWQCIKNDWLYAEGLLKADSGRTAYRSISHPGTAFTNHQILGEPGEGRDPQVSHMKDYRDFEESYDNGGVHINSGIPCKAFYLATQSIRQPSWEMAKLWFEALQDTNDDDFETFAGRTVKVTQAWATEGLKGFKEDAVSKVTQAWQAVGVEPKKFDQVTLPPTSHQESQSSAMEEAPLALLPPQNSPPSSKTPAAIFGGQNSPFSPAIDQHAMDASSDSPLAKTSNSSRPLQDRYESVVCEYYHYAVNGVRAFVSSWAQTR